MLKNIHQKIRSLYLQLFKDTTREPEDCDFVESSDNTSKYIILVKASLLDRIKFVLTNNLPYRLTKHQFQIISRNPLKEET